MENGTLQKYSTDTMQNPKINSENIVRIIFVCVLALMILRNLMNYNSLMILNDEFGYWGIAASLSGYNWKELISITPYYGFGYPILLAILLKFGFSMQMTYKMAVIGNAFMICGSYFMAIYCGRKCFPNISRKTIDVSSFFILLYSNTLFQAEIAWTETYLYFLFWLSMALVLLINEKASTTRIGVFILCLFAMFVTHQRTLGILISGFIVLTLLIMKRKINWKQATFIIALSVLLLSIYIILKKEIKNEYWTNSSLGMVNDFSTTSKSVLSLLSVTGIIGLIEGVCGRLFYFFCAGGIIFFMGFFLSIKNGVKEVLKMFSPKMETGLVYTYMTLSFLGSLGIAVLFMINNYTRLDIIVYGRYIENTVGPFLLFGICGLIERALSKTRLGVYIGSLGLMGFITIHYLSKVTTNDFVDVASVGTSFYFGTNDKYAAIYILVLVSVCIALMVFWGQRCYNPIVRLLPFILMAGLWIRNAKFVSEKIVSNIQEFRTKENFDVAEQLNDSGITDVYYLVGGEQYGVNAKYLQFWIADIEIHVIGEAERNLLPEDAVWIVENDSKKYYSSIKNSVINKRRLYTIATKKGSKWENVIERIEKR